MVPNNLDALRDKALLAGHDTDKKHMEGWITVLIPSHRDQIPIRICFNADGTVSWDRNPDLRHPYGVAFYPDTDRELDD